MSGCGRRSPVTSPAVTKQPHGQEAIGLGAAVVILFVALGSLLAMVLPIGMALAALGVGIGMLGIMGSFMNMPGSTTTLAAMIGLGVGIDYCLFVVTRYRQFLTDGIDPCEAAGRANATAGQAVVFAGATVVVAICGLSLSGLPSISAMGYGTAVVVGISVLSAISLLPAFLALAGHRINGLRASTRARKARKANHCASDPANTASGRWATHVSDHPWRYALVSLAALLALAAPVLGMRIGFSDDGEKAADTTQRQAYDLTAKGFGPGFNGTLLLTMQNRSDRRRRPGRPPPRRRRRHSRCRQGRTPPRSATTARPPSSPWCRPAVRPTPPPRTSSTTCART